MNESNECAIEILVKESLEAGALPEALRLHAEGCTSCGEIVELTVHLRALTQCDRIFVPPLGRVLARAEMATLAAKRRLLTGVMWSCAALLAVITCAFVAASGHPFPLPITPASAGLLLAVGTTIAWCSAPAGFTSRR